MKVVIRADASAQIGSGHIMRCLTLANGLAGIGAEVSFICRELPGGLCDLVVAKGFKVCRMPYQKTRHKMTSGSRLYEEWLGVSKEKDAKETAGILAKGPRPDWLVIDHYSLDKSWEALMRPHVKKIMVIDDLTNRTHDCDLLLNQSIFKSCAYRYNGLIPQSCKKIIGPKYALLRPEFIAARKKLRTRDGRIRRIFVFFGGSDITNETMKALWAIRSLGVVEFSVDVVAGKANAHIKEIEGLCSTMSNTCFYAQTEDMAKLMAQADLAIGASGTTTWERCCLGLPSLVMTIAENQAEIAANLASQGAVVMLGKSCDVTEKNIANGIRRLLDNPEAVRAMSLKATKLVNGMGTRRLIIALQNQIKNSSIRGRK